jgi:hypothetical protein
MLLKKNVCNTSISFLSQIVRWYFFKVKAFLIQYVTSCDTIHDILLKTMLITPQILDKIWENRKARVNERGIIIEIIITPKRCKKRFPMRVSRDFSKKYSYLFYPTKVLCWFWMFIFVQIQIYRRLEPLTPLAISFVLETKIFHSK